MTAAQPSSSWPPPAPPAMWAGAPKLDVPGLEQPARFVQAILTDDTYGHRGVLIVASEDGSMVTTAQLVKLAEGLDSLYAGEAPEGSRAWLDAKAAQWQQAADTLNSQLTAALQRAHDAEAALRERADVTDTGTRIEGLTFQVAQATRAHQEQARRAAALYAQRQEMEGQVEELTAILEQTRHERDEARATVLELGPHAAALREEVETLRADLHRVRTAAIEQRDGALTDALDQTARLRKANRAASDEVMGLRTEIRDLEEQRAELRDALVDLLRQLARRATGQIDAEREAATQRRRARSAVAGAAGALTTTVAAAALAWRHRR